MGGACKAVAALQTYERHLALPSKSLALELTVVGHYEATEREVEDRRERDLIL